MSRSGTKIGWPSFLLFTLAVCALVAAVACFVRAHQINQAEGQKIRDTQAMQLLAQRIALSARDAVRQEQLTEQIDRFEQLRSQSDNKEVNDAWSAFRSSLLEVEVAETEQGDSAPNFSLLVDLSDTLVVWLNENDSSLENNQSAAHLLQLAQNIQQQAEIDADSVPEKARGAWLFFDQILSQLETAQRNQSAADAEAASQSAALISELRIEFFELDAYMSDLTSNPETTLPAAGVAVAAQSSNRIESQEKTLLDIALQDRVTALGFAQAEENFWFRMGLLSAVAAVALLCIVALTIVSSTRRQNKRAKLVDQKNQDSIMRLLDEISALADGDLNTQATVSEDMTGAIADSFNYAIGELRRLVAAITSSADRVTVAVEETGSSAQQLARASSVQSREIQRSATYLSAMSDTMEQMSTRANEAAGIANQSVDMAVGGRRAVLETVEGMGRIRAQQQQTAMLLKRLSESSVQIGDIVNLINEVTSRSRLLALNSAIHSSSGAAENHRFSDIANEVQNLSTTLNESAHDIETLVNIIQDDAKAASESMVQTGNEMRRGQELANEAGSALKEIETISRRLSVVVEHLSTKTSKQSDVVNQLSTNMGVINDVTRRSAHGMQLSAAALGDLRVMASELRDGVSDFVLPPASKRFAQAGNDIVGRPLLKKREQPRSVSTSVVKPKASAASSGLTVVDG